MDYKAEINSAKEKIIKLENELNEEIRNGDKEMELLIRRGIDVNRELLTILYRLSAQRGKSLFVFYQFGILNGCDTNY